MEKEAEEKFEQYQEQNELTGEMKLKDFSQCIRDMNVRMCMLWGDEVGPIVKQEWTKVGGFDTKTITLDKFKEWWPKFLQLVEAERERVAAEEAELEAQKAARAAALEARYEGDIWTLPLQDMLEGVGKARERGKTALILDNTTDQRAETFFAYRSAHIVELKRMIMQKAVEKKSVETIVEDVRDRFLRGMCFKTGKPLILRMATAAFDFQGFNSEAFPFFSLLDAQEVASVTGIENAGGVRASPFYAMCRGDPEAATELECLGIHPDFCVIAITQFTPEKVEEYLADKMPMDKMQKILVTVD